MSQRRLGFSIEAEDNVTSPLRQVSRAFNDLETELNNDKRLHETTWYRLSSLGHLEKLQKVRLNHLGEIVQVGEY